MFSFGKKYSLKLIEIYQKYLSPDHSPLKKHFPGGYCKYSPTCSEYTKESIEKYGAFRGWRKGVWRIVRCNPFSKGGKDPVK